MNSKIQNPEASVFLMRNKNLKSIKGQSTINKVSINDFFAKSDFNNNKNCDFSIKRNLTIKNRNSNQKQDCMRNLSINKLRNLQSKNKRYLQENNIFRTTTNAERYTQIKKMYQDLEKYSFNTTLKQQVNRYRKHIVLRKASISLNKTDQQKQKLKRSSMSLGIKQTKQELSLNSSSIFNKSKNQSSNNFKDWSVYILKRKPILKQQIQLINLTQPDIKINTSFKLSVKRQKSSNPTESINQLCGWNEQKI